MAGEGGSLGTTPAGADEAGRPRFAVVGHLGRPHGTRGELHVEPLTDRPDSTFVEGGELLLGDARGETPDPARAPLRLVRVRPYRKGFLLTFEGVSDRDAAEGLRGRYLLRPFDDLEPLDEGEIFHHQLRGLRVVTSTGEEVGKVREIYPLQPADLLEIVGEDRAHLVPFTREIIVGWDLERGRLVIDPPAGLLDL